MSYDLAPLILTLKLALVTTAILVFLGVPLAYWLSVSRRGFKPIVEVLVTMPLVLPPTVLGFYILVALGPHAPLGKFLESVFDARVVFTFTGLVIGSVIFSLPFMVNPVKSGFESLPRSLTEAAYTLGKSPWETFRFVLLPNIKPALLTGTIMSFAHTIGEFGVVLMIGGNIPGATKVASIAIYEEVEALNYATANFYSAVLFVAAFVILMTLQIINKRMRKVIG